MTCYLVEKELQTHTTVSENVTEVAEMFGLGGRRDRTIKILDQVQIKIEKGDVVYITGGSGAGKSLLLNELKEQIEGAIDPAQLELQTGKPLVDCFGQADLGDILQWLSMSGLSDAFAMLRSSEQLSDGQRYRFRLALAMAKGVDVICMDEFCATLDRVTAAVVAHQVRKYADRLGQTFVVATSHDDLLEDLCPDVVVVKHLGSGCEVFYPGRGRKKQLDD